ncbi:MAG: hypothetical protein V3W20_10650 [Candidatus Neomarinimicrobiota bacterium]
MIMFSPECVKDLNFLMNYLNKIGYQYKANSCDFKADNEIGISAFLSWEEVERYEYSDKIRNHIVNNQGKVIYIMIPEPIRKGATLATLTDLVEFEKQTVAVIDKFIISAMNRKAITTQSFLMQLRHMCQHQYNEVNGIVSDIAKIIKDPGAMESYNRFLRKKFGESNKYDNPGKKHY